MYVILDNGHGINTPGKRSPLWSNGKQLLEWEFNRDIVKRISEKLNAYNIEYAIIVPEEKDVYLTTRARRANEIYKQRRDAIYISIHANAGGGSGWECFTSPGKTKSDQIAEIFYQTAEEYFRGWNIRKDKSDGDSDKESDFTVLTATHCPAILTENFFMDTYKDCQFILSEEGRDLIAEMHVAAIIKCKDELG